MQVEWDDKKAKSNLKKHKVSFEEGFTVLLNPLAKPFEDDDYAERTIWIGPSYRERVLFVVVVEKDDDLVRIISARKATPPERRAYEEG